MPIYEFYCPKCDTIYSFWSRAVNTEKIPTCPKCGSSRLERRISVSAIISSGKSSEIGELDDLPISESKMEEAITSLASEAEGIDENDPCQMARLMRRFSDKTGLKYNDRIEEALQKLESGEDPEKVEEEMGTLLDEDELPFEFKSAKGISQVSKKPKRDDTLYDL